MVAFAFVLGVALPLYVLAFLGQRILVKTRLFSRYTRLIQAGFGMIMILAALAIYTGFDKTLQTRLLDTFPGYERFLNGFEQNSAVQEELDALKGIGGSAALPSRPGKTSGKESRLQNYGPAPEIVGIEDWLNVETGLRLADLRGKVVLIDFWTYSCINCIRTLPHVTGWYEKYRDQGFVVIGVHTPEFAFEKKTANVAEAIERHGIRYPVAQDNDYATWQAYSNRYWPAHYLVDATGNIREYHFGEGNYVETEAAIRALLEEAGQSVDAELSAASEASRSLGPRTPETYLGSDRADRLASPESVTGVEQTFSDGTLLPDHFSLAGRWRIDSERAVAMGDARLTLRFRGEKVHLVLSPPASGGGLVKVRLDGNSIADSLAGRDVSAGALRVSESRLYDLVDLRGEPGEHVLQLEFETPETAAYAFTFS